MVDTSWITAGIWPAGFIIGLTFYTQAWVKAQKFNFVKWAHYSKNWWLNAVLLSHGWVIFSWAMDDF